MKRTTFAPIAALFLTVFAGTAAASNTWGNSGWELNQPKSTQQSDLTAGVWGNSGVDINGKRS